MPDQGKAVGVMSSTVPPDRFPDLVGWWFPLIGYDDRDNLMRIWQMMMPAEMFGGAKLLVQQAIGADWAKMTRRIPELAG